MGDVQHACSCGRTATTGKLECGRCRSKVARKACEARVRKTIAHKHEVEGLELAAMIVEHLLNKYKTEELARVYSDKTPVEVLSEACKTLRSAAALHRSVEVDGGEA